MEQLFDEDGKTTQKTHYPAQGEESLCPPNPKGFVGFPKSEVTQYPEESGKIVPPTRVEMTGRTLGSTNCIVPSSKKTYEEDTLTTEETILYEEDASKALFRYQIKRENLLYVSIKT